MLHELYWNFVTIWKDEGCIGPHGPCIYHGLEKTVLGFGMFVSSLGLWGFTDAGFGVFDLRCRVQVLGWGID